MTTEHEASRTLVKSPPELWAECSVAESLARHLAGSFGEIRITRLEPETAVAWEGECVSGTVRIEPSGWGTRVTLTAQTVEPSAAETEVAEEPVAEDVAAEDVAEEPDGDEPHAESEPAPRRPLLLERLRAFFRGPEPLYISAEPAQDGHAEPPDVSAESPAAEAIAEPAAVEPEPEPEMEIEPVDPEPPGFDPHAVLTAALDSLGQAHHRPFSRA
jgi:hypothetical protein